MAHSPSPGSGAGLSLATRNPRRTSHSPPHTQQPPSKRDKRRAVMDQKLKDIATNFTSSRDLHLRTQLNALSRDMQHITRADLYTNRLLDDGSEDLSSDPNNATVPISVVPGSLEGETRVSLGGLASKFVEDINDEMEKRDSALTDVDLLYKKQLEGLKLDFKFAAEVAETECSALKEAARNRVTSAIQTKKKQIQKEKDQLDTADSSFLMNSHALTAITAPGSPGGLHGNRKTRHTRHRQDLDALEPTDLQRRKRKANDTDNVSPAPMLRTASIDAFGTLLWEKSKGPIESDSSAASVSIDRFFNSKELASHNRSAVNSVAQAWSDKRSKKSINHWKSSHGETANGELSDTEHRGNNSSDDDVDPEDMGTLLAPLMDRTGSHATRSSRINQLELMAHRDNIEDLDDPQRSYGSAVLDASSARSKVAQSKDVEAPLTTGMTHQDISDDLSIMQSLVSTFLGSRATDAIDIMRPDFRIDDD